MLKKRYSPAAASHPSHGWVITGGCCPFKSSAESTRDGRTFQSFTDLPLGLSGHCLVSLEGGDGGDFLLTGGVSEEDSNKKTFIYQQGKWRQVEDMPTGRQGKKKPN